MKVCTMARENTTSITINIKPCIWKFLPCLHVKSRLRTIGVFSLPLDYSTLWAYGGKCNEENTKYEHDSPVGTTNEKLDLFSADILNGGANWTRSVINGKVAVNFTYKHYLIGADVAYGFNGDLWGIGLSVGYNF